MQDIVFGFSFDTITCEEQKNCAKRTKNILKFLHISTKKYLTFFSKIIAKWDII